MWELCEAQQASAEGCALGPDPAMCAKCLRKEAETCRFLSPSLTLLCSICAPRKANMCCRTRGGGQGPPGQGILLGTSLSCKADLL